MTNDATHIPVLAAPNWNPGSDRVYLDLPHGLTVAEIVHHALPGARAVDLEYARVTLVTPHGMETVATKYWTCVRPKPGVRVVVRIIPGKGALRAILSVVVTVAAVALGGIWGPTVAGWLGASNAVGTALVTAGITALGNLAINALVPPPTADDQERINSYSISGWRNRAVPNGAVPVVLGRVRIAPPFAALPYTEIVGDKQYVRSMFLLGEGEVFVDDMKIGETSLSEFDEVETEVRYGVDGDAPIAIYPRQIVEEQIGVELTRPLPRDDAGNIISGPAEEAPVVRTTGADASGASIILAWPAGLIRYNDKGKRRWTSVTVLVEQRRVDAQDWEKVKSLTIWASKAEGFFRQHTWQFPERGRWQVRLTMMTGESTDAKLQRRTNWMALQTLRPEYPLAYPRPLALVALRVKATHQLSGALDNFTLTVSRKCWDWDRNSKEWVWRETENPASLYRHVLQDPANPKAVSDNQIDLDQLSDWHEFCEDNGLTYNKALAETGRTLGDVLREIAAAGRAAPRHDGRVWGVVIDRPSNDALIVDHIDARNSWSFSWRRPYVEPPHAFVVTFPDAGNDYKETQRQIRWPGYSGEITLTEELPLPGKVYADEVWREARRRQLEQTYRLDTYEATQDGRVRVAERGDDVMLNHVRLSRFQMAARVKRVVGHLIEIDEMIEMTEGGSYAIRFRYFEDEQDTVGSSVIRPVVTEDGAHNVIQLPSVGQIPAVGTVIQFGPANSISRHQIIQNVEATQDGCSILRMIDAAPEIDEELAATEIPEWSSRVGAEIDSSHTQPPVPMFTEITSGASGTDVAGRVSVSVTAGPGYVPSDRFEIQHRLLGGDWVTIEISAASGGAEIDAYATGDQIEIRARAISATGAVSDYTPAVAHSVGGEDADIPAALDDDAVSVTTLLGGVLVQFATSDDAATTSVQVYCSTSSTLDRKNDAVGAPILVDPNASFAITVGDTTRENLISGGTMNSADQWSVGSGWAISGGVALHTSGDTAPLACAVPTVAGKYYRIGFDVPAVSAGTLTPQLNGTTDRPGVTVSKSGQFSDRIQAVTGNDAFGLHPSPDFDGSADNAVLYLETAACLPAGIHKIWLEPINDDGLAGPMSGPFEVNII